MRWSAAFLYAAGFEIEWSRVSPPGRFIRLPSYPWRRDRYWLDDEEAAPRVVAAADVIPTVAAAEGPDDLIDYLRDRTAGILGLSPDQVNLDRPLLAMGLDSLTAMELKAEIDAHLGVKLPLSVLIEGSSIRDVAGARASIAAMTRRRRPASRVRHPRSRPRRGRRTVRRCSGMLTSSREPGPPIISPAPDGSTLSWIATPSCGPPPGHRPP